MPPQTPSASQAFAATKGGRRFQAVGFMQHRVLEGAGRLPVSIQPETSFDRAFASSFGATP